MVIGDEFVVSIDCFCVTDPDAEVGLAVEAVVRDVKEDVVGVVVVVEVMVVVGNGIDVTGGIERLTMVDGAAEVLGVAVLSVVELV